MRVDKAFIFDFVIYILEDSRDFRWINQLWHFTISCLARVKCQIVTMSFYWHFHISVGISVRFVIKKGWWDWWVALRRSPQAFPHCHFVFGISFVFSSLKGRTVCLSIIFSTRWFWLIVLWSSSILPNQLEFFNIFYLHPPSIAVLGPALPGWVIMLFTKSN